MSYAMSVVGDASSCGNRIDKWINRGVVEQSILFAVCKRGGKPFY
jgi:hypothetical protein